MLTIILLQSHLRGAMDQTEELFAAIQAGNIEQVGSLISSHHELASARDATGVSAILRALYSRRKDVVEILVQSNSALDVFEAAALGKLDRVAELVAADPELAKAWSADGFTALHLTAFFGRQEVARFLLEHGADPAVASRNSMQVTPLNSAAAARQVEIARALLEHGAPVNAAQHGGWTALHSAAHNGDLKLVELLLQHGADRSLNGDSGKTAYDFALEAQHLDVCRRLEES
jgi:uncharacterized protein